MSAFGKQGRRCDTCGKFSRGKLTGEYTRKDGSCGYIWPEDQAIEGGDPSKDYLRRLRRSEARAVRESILKPSESKHAASVTR